MRWTHMATVWRHLSVVTTSPSLRSSPDAGVTQGVTRGSTRVATEQNTSNELIQMG
jgi:hypothetical protein